MKMTEGLATVIVPAYNVETYIGSCLESLLAQTYSAIEIIVVDDGSTDGTSRVVGAFASHDARVRLFRNANHGVSFSRNYAIKRGRGEFLLFVDADDVVASDYVETLVAPLASGDCQCSVCGIDVFSNKLPSFSDGTQELYREDEIFLAYLDKCGGFLCNKGFLYCIIRNNNLLLDESIAQSEDMLFLLGYLRLCDALSFDSGIKYGYRQRSDSAANSQESTKWFGAIKVYEAYESAFEGDGTILEKVHATFLPIAYEAAWRYSYCGLCDVSLSARIDKMRMACEKSLGSSSLARRAKMFVYRHFMGLEMRRRRMVAR